MTIYSKNLRDRVMKYLLARHTYRGTAKVFNVSANALCRWKKMLEEQGSLDDKPRKKFFRKIGPQKLKEYLEGHPDAYLREIGAIFGRPINAVSKT